MNTTCNQQTSQSNQKTKLKVLILDGHNNHYVWPKTTVMMKDYLEQTGLFEVEVSRTNPVWLGIKYNDKRQKKLVEYFNEYPIDISDYIISQDPIKSYSFNINFHAYDLVVSNLGAFTPNWSIETKVKFENYMSNGGGLVVIHAANNAWGDWAEFNKMIGLGAWGNRDSASGPYVFYDDKGKIQKDNSEGLCGSHGVEHEFIINSRTPEHSIMKDLPIEWLHAKDELYDRMRGPFQEATILATAYSDIDKNEQSWEPHKKGSGRHAPILLTINYGQGRIFHSTLGHFDYSMECVGFITTFQRGAEWAATGAVTQTVPEDFPTKLKTSSRVWQ